MAARWSFMEFTSGRSPARGDSNALRSAGLSAEDLLVREAIQNSADEVREDAASPVLIRFEKQYLTGDRKKAFIETLGLRALAERSSEAEDDEGWYGNGRTALSTLDDPELPMPVLIYSDHHTNGLTGRWNKARDKDDRFHRLVLAHSRSKKQKFSAGNSIGSYGVGKQAFALCSEIRVVGYYSHFQATEASEENSKRLMFTGLLPDHVLGDDDFTGHCYWGESSEDKNYPVKPLVDESADQLMQLLQLGVRQVGETGTTVILPFCDFSIEQLREKIENWWWPRLLQPEFRTRVEFELIDDGSQISPPKPDRREDLIPFIECFKSLNSKDGGDKYKRYDIDIKGVSGSNGTKAGRLSLTAVGESVTSVIALIRSGFVIAYDKKFLFEDKAPVVGVFEPFDDNVQAFAYSEPEAHHEWQPEHGRLKEAMPWGPRFVASTLARIQQFSRDFQRSFDQVKPAGTNETASFLDRSLAQLFNHRKKGKPHEPVNMKRAFSIQAVKKERSFEDSSRAFENVVYKLKLSEHVNEESVPVIVQLRAKVATSADGAGFKPLHCEVSSSVSSDAIQDDGSLFLILGSSDVVEITGTAKVNKNWITQWDISVVKRVAND